METEGSVPASSLSSAQFGSVYGISYQELIDFAEKVCGGKESIGSFTVKEVYKLWIEPLLQTKPHSSYVDLIHPTQIADVPISFTSSVQITVKDKRELQRNILIAMSLEDCFLEILERIESYFITYPYLRYQTLLWIDIFCVHGDVLSWQTNEKLSQQTSVGLIATNTSSSKEDINKHRKQQLYLDWLQDHCISIGHCLLILPSLQHSTLWQSAWTIFQIYLSKLGDFYCDIALQETDLQAVIDALNDVDRFPEMSSTRYEDILNALLDGNKIEWCEGTSEVRWYEALLMDSIASNQEAQDRLTQYIHQIIQQWIIGVENKQKSSTMLQPPNISWQGLEALLSELTFHNLLPDLEHVQCQEWSVVQCQVEELQQQEGRETELQTYLLQQLLIRGTDPNNSSTASTASMYMWWLVSALLEYFTDGPKVSIAEALQGLLLQSLISPSSSLTSSSSSSTTTSRSNLVAAGTDSATTGGAVGTEGASFATSAQARADSSSSGATSPTSSSRRLGSNPSRKERISAKHINLNLFFIKLQSIRFYCQAHMYTNVVSILIHEHFIHQIMEFFGEMHLITIQCFHSLSECYLCLQQIQQASLHAEYTLQLAIRYFGESDDVKLVFYQTHYHHIQMIASFQFSQQRLLSSYHHQAMRARVRMEVETHLGTSSSSQVNAAEAKSNLLDDIQVSLRDAEIRLMEQEQKENQERLFRGEHGSNDAGEAVIFEVAQVEVIPSIPSSVIPLEQLGEEIDIESLPQATALTTLQHTSHRRQNNAGSATMGPRSYNNIRHENDQDENSLATCRLM